MENMNYLQGIAAGVKTLCVGLKTTMREFFTKKITEQYPENRKELVMFDRFRGSLVMPHNENNEHKCIACGLCMTNCPNGTIEVKSKMVETEDGKKKKILDEYIYDQGICMYCQVCVRVCPQDAITFDQSYETAVFDRQKLVRQLNQPGSKCQERKPVARPAAAPKPAEKPAAATASAPVEAADAAEKTPKTE
ncbi:MAG: 4Fe-4S binding protein [Alloprevotella sp.]|nr:4Fe-4S binding protein [Alloprevotella sp.]MBR1733424.1 4Fe-4S binding protein [Alloprevotella sp.]